MGADKAFLEFRGQTLVERALTTARGVCEQVTIVGDAVKFVGYGAVVEDVYPGCGPLAGIHAALRSSQAELNLVLAVDMPLVTRELLAFLLSVATDSDASVVVPRAGRGFQPLCAVYRRDFAAVAEGALRAGKYKVDALFSGVRVQVIEEEDLKQLGFAESEFFNVNTPVDLRTMESG